MSEGHITTWCDLEQPAPSAEWIRLVRCLLDAMFGESGAVVNSSNVPHYAALAGSAGFVSVSSFPRLDGAGTRQRGIVSLAPDAGPNEAAPPLT